MRYSWVTVFAAIMMLSCSVIGVRAQDTATPPAAEAPPVSRAGLDEGTIQILKTLRADMAVVVPVELKNLPEGADPIVSCVAIGGRKGVEAEEDLDVMAEGFARVLTVNVDEDARQLFEQGLISKDEYEAANKQFLSSKAEGIAGARTRIVAVDEHELFSQGLISKEEYETANKRLLSGKIEENTFAIVPDVRPLSEIEISKKVIVELTLKDNAEVSDFSDLQPLCALYLASALDDHYEPLLNLRLDVAPTAGVQPNVVYPLTWSTCTEHLSASADVAERKSPHLFPLVCAGPGTEVSNWVDENSFDNFAPLKSKQ